MEKYFVPYAEASALEELGFNEPFEIGNQTTYYEFEKDMTNAPKVISCNDGWKNMFNDYTYVLRPLYSQAFRWFREKYKLQAEIIWRGDMECFCYKTGNFKYGSHDFSKNDYKTYEEAELACLKKLIEIVKNNKNE